MNPQSQTFISWTNCGYFGFIFHGLGYDLFSRLYFALRSLSHLNPSAFHIDHRQISDTGEAIDPCEEYQQHVEANTPTFRSTSADQSTPAFPSNQNGVSNVQRGANNTWHKQQGRVVIKQSNIVSCFSRTWTERSPFTHQLYFVHFSHLIYLFWCMSPYYLYHKIYSKTLHRSLCACAWWRHMYMMWYGFSLGCNMFVVITVHVWLRRCWWLRHLKGSGARSWIKSEHNSLDFDQMKYKHVTVGCIELAI